MEFYELVQTMGAASGLVCLTCLLLSAKKHLKTRFI